MSATEPISYGPRGYGFVDSYLDVDGTIWFTREDGVSIAAAPSLQDLIYRNMRARAIAANWFLTKKGT